MRLVAAFALRRCALRLAAEIRAVRPVAATMAPAPAEAATVTVLIALALVVAVAAAHVRLRLVAAAGDEGRQAADVAFRLRLVLRALRHLLIARREGLRVARNIRLLLRLGLSEARLILAHIRLALVTLVIEVIAALRRAGLLALLRLLLVVRILLAELLLRGGDQAEIMLGVLVIIFRRHRVARALRISRQLDVFFRNVRRSAADLHVGSVRFVDPRQRILALAMAAAAPHALLTVSHDMPAR